MNEAHSVVESFDVNSARRAVRPTDRIAEDRCVLARRSSKRAQFPMQFCLNFWRNDFSFFAHQLFR